MLIIWV